MKFFELSDGEKTLKMPSLSYGTASFEDITCKEHYFALLDKYVELGGTCIDTARAYCAWLENGEGVSERVIGEWLKLRGNREKVTIVTKGGHPNFYSMGISRLSAEEINSDINASLEALGVESVDVYLLHRDDPTVPVSEIMPVLDGIVKSGRAKFIGVSNWRTARIEKANEFARANGLAQLSISQINYSLAHSSRSSLGDATLVCMDTVEYAWYSRNNFPLMAFSPQAKGFFSKTLAGESLSQTLEASFISTANLARTAKVKEISERTGLSPAAVVLGYLWSQPFPVSSVFSTTKLSQLADSMTAQDVEFDEATLALLENKIGYGSEDDF